MSSRNTVSVSRATGTQHVIRLHQPVFRKPSDSRSISVSVAVVALLQSYGT